MNHELYGRHLSNTIKRSMVGGDAGFHYDYVIISV